MISMPMKFLIALRSQIILKFNLVSELQASSLWNTKIWSSFEKENPIYQQDIVVLSIVTLSKLLLVFEKMLPQIFTHEGILTNNQNIKVIGRWYSLVSSVVDIIFSQNLNKSFDNKPTVFFIILKFLHEVMFQPPLSYRWF